MSSTEAVPNLPFDSISLKKKLLNSIHFVTKFEKGRVKNSTGPQKNKIAISTDNFEACFQNLVLIESRNFQNKQSECRGFALNLVSVSATHLAALGLIRGIPKNSFSMMPKFVNGTVRQMTERSNLPSLTQLNII